MKNLTFLKTLILLLFFTTASSIGFSQSNTPPTATITVDVEGITLFTPGGSQPPRVINSEQVLRITGNGLYRGSITVNSGGHIIACGNITLYGSMAVQPGGTYWRTPSTRMIGSFVIHGTTNNSAGNCTLAPVCDNFTNAGSINGAQTSCGSYNPTSMGNAGNPSGGSGDTQYQWQDKTTGDWDDIDSANSATYDPSIISITTQYQRGARRSGCSTYIFTASITKAVTSNFTNAGSINGAETSCGSYNPGNMGNASSPSGGSGGSIEYQWQYKTTGGWNNIGSSNSATYDPSTISITTQYQRGARRNGCSTYIYTASITKAVDALPVISSPIDQTLCNTSNFTMAQSASIGTGVWTVVSSTGTAPTITTNNSVTTTVTGLPAGTSAVLRWTVTNGTCSISDDVSIQNDVLPVISSPIDQTLCNTSNFTMAQSASIGTGVWTVVSSTGTAPTITTNNSVTTTVTGLPAGTSAVLRWTVTNGTCSISDDVSIQNDVLPVISSPIDQTLCNTSNFTMAQSASIGTGVWTVVSSTGTAPTITAINSATTTVTGLPAGTSAVLRWTVTNGTCSISDDVSIQNDVLPVISSPIDQTLCNTSNFTMAQSASIGTGVWTVVSSTGTAPTITAINSATTTVTGLLAGTSAVLRWTVTNGTCSISDDVSIQNDAQIITDNTTTTVAINEDQTKSLTGTPSGGSWSIVSGSGFIAGSTYTPVDINTNTSVTIRYTIAADGSCEATSDDVTFTVTPVVVSWDGSVDGNWLNVNNWSTNILPTINAVVLIPGGLDKYPTVTGSVSVNSVIMNSGSSLTATGPVSVNSVIMNSGSSLIAEDTFIGALTYNRTLSDTWHLIASPVVGETIENMYLKNNFIQAGNGDIGLAPYQHDSNTWGFYKDTSTGTITSGQGYSSKLASLGDVSFTGTMATTDISISSFGRTIDYNLVGNPYPSYLNIESFLNDNSDSLEEMTLWMDSYDVIEQKSVYQPISLVSNLKHIAPAQGFFVQPKEESTVLNFTEDMQSHQSVDTFQKTSSSERPEIKLLMTNGTSTKYTDIFYIEGTTTGFDNGYDSSIFNSTESFSIYTNTITNSAGRKLAIQSLPNSDYESMVVPIGITADADKEITFSATTIKLPAGIKVYLEDRELNVFTELVADVYKVDLAAAVNGVGRFYLHTSQKVLDVSDVPILTNIKIYTTTTNTNLRIVGLPEGAKALKLYNIIGQEIMSTSFNTNGVKDIALPNLSKGVYTVQLKIGSEIIREKIFLE